MTIQCSHCGEWTGFRYSERKMESMAEKGWGSVGDALYCPKCTATWHERNEKPLWPKDHTIELLIKKRRQQR